MRRFRRGQQEMQFNWIFALVGGALFLLFFFILIRSITTSHEDTNVRQLSFAVETILTRAASTPEMFSKAELQNEEYTIACERDAASFSSYVRIGANDYDPAGLRYVPVFSPSSIKGEELFILTRTWEAPFPIGSLLLVSNNRTRYVFVGAPQRLRAFVDSENLGAFNIIYVGADAVSGLRDEGFDQYRFVFFTDNPRSVPSDIGKKSTALVVSGNTLERGTVKFYKHVASGWQQQQPSAGFSYYGTAMLDAAIFSDDAAKFSCNMVKAAERLNTVILILQKRLNTLRTLTQETNPSVPVVCAEPYATAINQLTEYKNVPSSAFSRAANTGDGPIVELERLNQQANANDCPSIY